jgi:hypothetical protein
LLALDYNFRTWYKTSVDRLNFFVTKSFTIQKGTERKNSNYWIFFDYGVKLVISFLLLAKAKSDPPCHVNCSRNNLTREYRRARQRQQQRAIYKYGSEIASKFNKHYYWINNKEKLSFSEIGTETKAGQRGKCGACRRIQDSH